MEFVSINITYVIVGLFLFITLSLGVYAGRDIKNIKEYALGSGRFSTITLVLTFLATNIGGGSIMGMLKSTYSVGIIGTVACFGVIIQFLLFALLLGPKIKNFKNCITIGDIYGQLYGEKAKFLAGIITSLYILFKSSIQLMAIGKACELIMGLNSTYAIIISGGILAVYSSYGGIKSVTATDVLQFLIIIIAFPIIASIIMNKVGGYDKLFSSLPKTHLQVYHNKEFYYYLTLFLIWSIMPMCLLNQADMQRVFMASNKIQVKKQFLIISVLDPIFRIVIMIIGLGAIILFPNIQPDKILSNIIHKLLNPVLKGVAISGVIAVIMSTADSFFHAAGVVLSNDVLEPILSKRSTKYSKLFLARITTSVMIVMAIILAINSSNLLHLTVYAAKLAGPPLLFPLFIGILGIKTDKRSFIIGMIGGILMLCIFEHYMSDSKKILAIPIGILANALAYMVSHIIQNKGIAWIREGDGKETKIWIPNSEKIFSSITNAIPTPKKIFNFCRYQIVKYGSPHMIFGIYACINFTLPYFLWDSADTDKYNLMTSMRFIGGILAGLLIVKNQWKEFLKPYYPIFWYSIITYCLPFIATMMFLLTKGSLPWLMNIGTAIFFLILLVTGEIFLILAPIGVALAIIFHKYYIGPVNLGALGFNVNYYLVYQILFSTAIGLLFAYRKRVFNVKQSTIGLNLGESMCHELKNTLYSITCNQFNKSILKQIKGQTPKIIKGTKNYIVTEDSLNAIYNKTEEAINFENISIKVIRAFERLFRDYKKSIDNPGVYSMKSIVRYTIKELYSFQQERSGITLELLDDFYIKIPKWLFTFVLSNIIRNAFKHGGATNLKIILSDREIILRDNGKGISSSDLEKIFTMHYTTNKDSGSTGIGLGFAKIIVNSFYGEIWCESNQGEDSFTEFHIKFPEVDPSKINEESLQEIKEEIIKEAANIQKEEIAAKMLKNNRPIKEIMEFINLSESEIEIIKKKRK